MAREKARKAGSMVDTLRLKLPLLDAAQAQKHITHNQALNMLDLLVQISVKNKDLSDPPATAHEGDTYIVGESAMNDWAGREKHIAHYRDGGWIFQAPLEGQLAYIENEAGLFVFAQGSWGAALSGVSNSLPDGGVRHDILVKQSGENGDAVWQNHSSSLGINTTPDNTNRLSAKSDAVLFSHDDVTPGSGDVRVNVNKAAVGGNASIVFQNSFSGRAEFGLTGDDNFHIKVSPDGTVWHDALVLDKDTGNVFADKPLRLKGFATASLPDATQLQGGLVYDTDADMPKWSDGALWQSFATADQSGAQIKALYEAEADTNVFSDADKAKLNHISVTSAVNLHSDFQPRHTTLSNIAATTWAEGDLLTVNHSGAVTRLAKGINGQVLSLVSGAPAWVNENSGGGSGVLVIQQSILSETAIAPGTLAGTVVGATQIGII